MNFQLHFDIPFYLFLLFGALSAALAFLMYRRLEGLSRPRQTFLGILRGMSLFLLFLAMTNLVTDIVHLNVKKRKVFLLVDDSKSMSLSDGSVPRPQVVREILESSSYANLSRYFEISPIVFGGTTLEKQSVDSLRYDQPATNIQSAIDKASAMSGNGEAAFAMLISDGDYNTGGSPVDAARNLNFPLFTIGVGDSVQPKDVVVKQVITAPSIYAGKSSVVRAVISSNGFGDAKATVLLLEDGREVDSKDVTLPQNGDVEVSFNYTPASVGTHVLRVYVPPLNGEFSRRNNSASATANVLKGKYSVLLVAGEPATDVAFLRRNLEGSEDFDVRVLVQKTGESFYEKGAAGAFSQKYDAVLLYDFPNAESEGTLREVIHLLSTTGSPFAYFAGSEFSAAKVSTLPRLPFVTTGLQPGELQVGVSLVDAGSLPATLQPIHALLSSSSALLPPLYYRHIQCKPAPGAVSLASPVVNGVRLDAPMLVISPANRSAAFLAYGLWRLQLMSSLSGLRSDFLQDFLTTLIRTLISGGRQRLLTVHTDKKVYDPSEQINFNALLVDQGGAPVNDATVDLDITDESSRRPVSEIRLMPTGDGGYTGSASGLGEGRYLFTAYAKSGATNLGSDSGTVVVEPLNAEFAQTAMNATLLKQIAVVSGGEFVTPSEFLQHGVDLRADWKQPVLLHESKRFELLSSLPVLALVFLLLAAEWTLRKIWGLP